MRGRVLAFIGETDCEALGDGLLRQPANAVTSLAYAAAGIVAIVLAEGVVGEERAFRRLFGWAMIATGIGSVLYHGPQWVGSHFIHDVTFAATLWLIASLDATRALGHPLRVSGAVLVAGITALAVILLLVPAATNAITVILAAALVASDVIVHRATGVIPSWYAAALGAAALAVAALLLGRTDWPLCDPDSLAQGHGIWHVLSAAALLCYFMGTTPARTTRSETTA